MHVNSLLEKDDLMSVQDIPQVIEKYEIPCPICDNKEFKVVFEDQLGNTLPPINYDFTPATRNTFQIVKCISCDFIFTNPMPALSDAYHDSIDEAYLESSAQRLITAKKSMKYIDQFKNSGKLLDVGCAMGLFLDAAKEKFEVQGIELSQWAADIASKKHLVHRQPLSQLNLTDKFEVITLWGVIEHFENPRAEIEATYAALKPGGLLVIYTGDVDAWLPKLLGKKWWWFQGMHLLYFSRKTLTLLLKRVGFEVIHHRNHTLYFQLFSLAKSLNRYKIGRLFFKIFNLPFIKNITIPLTLSGEMVLYARKN